MATLLEYDKANTLILTDSTDEFLQYSVDDWIACANKNIQNKGAFFVALSGGKTPLDLFVQLVERKHELIDPEKIYLFWGDERFVPLSSSENNCGQAMRILKDLGVNKDHVFRMATETPQGAWHYENLLKMIVPNANLDMLMLGMGADGHTLSLFPGTQALQEKERLVVINHVPQLETERMTLTFPAVHKSSHRVVYVRGQDKQNTVHQIFFSNEVHDRFPIQEVGDSQHPLLWILSPEAYSTSDLETFLHSNP